MILTLTLNPTIDHVIFVNNFQLGATIRATSETRTPSGKGIGSSLVIQELGGETTALGFRAGHAGKMLGAMLDERGIVHRLLPAQGETRIATVLVDGQTGQQSTISSATLEVSPQHLAGLLTAIRQYASHSWGIICAGSIPRGLDDDSYATILEHTRQLGLFTILDTSGEALEHGIKGLPHLLKVNMEEALGLQPDLNLSVDSPESTRQSLGNLRQLLGIWASEAIIITLGNKGAIAVTPSGCYTVQPPSVPVVNTAGAGDAFSASLMLSLSRGDTWKHALTWGTAAAVSVVMNAGTAICQRAQVDELFYGITVNEVHP